MATSKTLLLTIGGVDYTQVLVDARLGFEVGDQPTVSVMRGGKLLAGRFPFDDAPPAPAAYFGG